MRGSSDTDPDQSPKPKTKSSSGLMIHHSRTMKNIIDSSPKKKEASKRSRKVEFISENSPSKIIENIEVENQVSRRTGEESI